MLVRLRNCETVTYADTWLHFQSKSVLIFRRMCQKCDSRSRQESRRIVFRCKRLRDVSIGSPSSISQFASRAQNGAWTALPLMHPTARASAPRGMSFSSSHGGYHVEPALRVKKPHCVRPCSGASFFGALARESDWACQRYAPFVMGLELSNAAHQIRSPISTTALGLRIAPVYHVPGRRAGNIKCQILWE